MAVTEEWTGEGRPVVAATAHKGLIELEATPAQTMDTSAPSETAFSGVMSDQSSASVKARQPAVMSHLTELDLLARCIVHTTLQSICREVLWSQDTVLYTLCGPLQFWTCLRLHYELIAKA